MKDNTLSVDTKNILLIDSSNRDKKERNFIFLLKKLVNSIKLKNKALLYLIPCFIPIFLFIFYPLLKTIILSTHMTNARGEMVVYVGSDNFVEYLTSSDFRNNIITTLKFSIFTSIVATAISVFLGVLASEKIKGMGIFRTIFSSTLGISVAAGATIWLFMFHPSIGSLNTILTMVGIPPIKWLLDTNYSLISVGLTTIWMEVSFGFLIITASLSSIPKEIHESSLIDGSGYFSKLYNIILPLISHNIYYLITINLIKALQSFGQINILTNGGPINSTTTLVYALWKTAFIDYRFGMASCIGIILALISIIIVIFQVILKRGGNYYE